MASSVGTLRMKNELLEQDKSKVVSLTPDEVAQLRHTKITEWPNLNDM